METCPAFSLSKGLCLKGYTKYNSVGEVSDDLKNPDCPNVLNYHKMLKNIFEHFQKGHINNTFSWFVEVKVDTMMWFLLLTTARGKKNQNKLFLCHTIGLPVVQIWAEPQALVAAENSG